MQEPTVYQTELVFHATRCKQIYLIRTPCSYCIQSHFLYRQKGKKKGLAANFYNITKTPSELSISLSKKEVFYLLF